MRALRYQYPQSIYTPEFLSHGDAIAAQRPTLQLSANQAHARWWRAHTTPRASMYAETHTLQSFLLRSVLAVTPLRVLSAHARMTFVQRAWREVNGPLYGRYGGHRGAVSEIAAALSFLSGQRQQWGVTHDLDTSTELGAVYAEYQKQLIHEHAIAYDDVALHFTALDSMKAPYECLLAVELHEANPAQLNALRRLIDQVPAGFVGAWLPPATEAPNPAPELAAVERFLAAFPAATAWNHTANPSAALIDRLWNPAAPVPQVTYTAMAGAHMRLGVDTSTDEVQIAAQTAHAALRAGKSVSIVCADPALIIPLRTALAEAGVPLPLYSTPQQANPLIRISQHLIAVHTASDESARRHAARAGVSVGRDLQQTDPVDQRTTDPAAEQRFLDAGMNLTIDGTLAAQLERVLEQWGHIAQVWDSNVQLPSIVRDHWLREWKQWLAALSAETATDDVQNILRLVESLDATPTPERMLRDTALPLTISGPRGAPAETDTLIVIGLHEGALPRRARGFEIVTEAALATALREPIGYLPHHTDLVAVRARELRRAAAVVGSNAADVVLSVAYYGPNGKPQLPTAFFAAWSQGSLVFDPHGNLVVDSQSSAAPLRVSAEPLPPPFTQSNLSVDAHQVLHDNHFSNSQLQSYLSCPRKYFYQKVARTTLPVDEEEVESGSIGSLFHEILCAALGTGATVNVDLRERDLATTAALWRDLQPRLDAIRSHAISAPAGTTLSLPNGDRYTPTQPWHRMMGSGLVRLQNEQTLETLLARWRIAEENEGLGVTRRPILLEHEFDLVLDGMHLKGRIDRVDEITDSAGTRLEVIDYKTGNPAKQSGKNFLERLGLRESAQSDSDGNTQDDQDDSALGATDYQTLLYLLVPLPHDDGLYPATSMAYGYFKQPKQTATKAPDKKTPENVRYRRIIVVPDETKIKKASKNNTTVLYLGAHDIASIAVPAMQQTMHAMRQTPYPIKPGNHCAYCDYASICDAVVTDATDEGGV